MIFFGHLSLIFLTYIKIFAGTSRHIKIFWALFRVLGKRSKFSMAKASKPRRQAQPDSPVQHGPATQLNRARPVQAGCACSPKRAPRSPAKSAQP